MDHETYWNMYQQLKRQLSDAKVRLATLDDGRHKTGIPRLRLQSAKRQVGRAEVRLVDLTWDQCVDDAISTSGIKVVRSAAASRPSSAA